MVMRARGLVALALVTGAAGCADVLGFSADGGTSSGLDASMESGSSSGGGGDGGDAGVDGAGCVAIVPSPSEPTKGAGACDPNDGAVCYPHDVTTLQGAWVPPFGPHAGACTAAQIGDYYSACVTTGTSCAAWRSKNATCDGCLEPPAFSPHSGAYIGAQSAAPSTNIGGCVALAEPCNLACAQALMADQECENAACDPNPGGACAVDNQATDNEFLACITAADNGCGCTGFALTYSACLKELAATPGEHPAATTCALKGNAQTQFVAVATEICGP